MIKDLVSYAGLSGVGPSDAIWQHVPADVLAGRSGFYLHEDFTAFDGASNAYRGSSGAWKSYEDTGSTVAVLETEVGGVLKITTDTTDNDEIWLGPGPATQVLGKITTGDSEVLAFECRVRPNQIVTQNFFCGLMEEGCVAENTITDAGAIATTKDHLGFAVLEGASSTMTFKYGVASATFQTPISSLKTIVAATWYKFGFLYTSKGPDSKRIRVFVDGVEQSTYVTATNIAATTTFPSDQELNPIIGLKNGAGAATRWDVDWIRCAGTGGR